jgi:HrpA-like RNA helicase
LRAEGGSILAFLPGQGEIRRVAQMLDGKLPDNAELAPLYGAMDRAAQDRAVLPAKAGKRKIVLATSIAETSLTIEGVRVVIDSGLARVPRFEPDLGLTRLETMRVSRAAADQRRGRAGRTEPGVCYRLWEEAATGALEAFSQPEILSADLSSLFLDLAACRLPLHYAATAQNKIDFLEIRGIFDFKTTRRIFCMPMPMVRAETGADLIDIEKELVICNDPPDLPCLFAEATNVLRLNIAGFDDI